jgi:cytochrome c peroxidase
MSRSSTVSCASCHLAAFAFSDTVSFSDGVDGAPGVRNAPTLANVAYHPYYTREGGVPTLEMQVLVPIQEHNEFDFNIIEIADRLKNDADYQQMSEKAYGKEPDHFVITRALATFERSLISGNSRFDQYHYRGDKKAMTEEELQGMELFFGNKANCAACHGDFNFTDYSFQNNGLYTSYADEGRFRLTSLEKDRALFKVPSLRNIELTGPYMHDGSIKSLEEVIAHYNSGGEEHPNKSELVKPLNLNVEEKASLVAFLKTLTDLDFVSNKKFKQ